MGVFSEIVMEQQNSMFDSSAAFEDDEAFELGGDGIFACAACRYRHCPSIGGFGFRR